MSIQTSRRSLTILLVLQLGAFSASHALDGQILINQSNALAGSVTPGDSPGFPVTLSQRGSYRLSSDLVVPDQNTTALQPTADNITIDLNGFSIAGPNLVGSGDGISAGSRTNVTVLNGTVTGMGARGVHLGNKARAESLRVISNTDGLQVGIDSLIREVTALNNRVAGIIVFGQSSITLSVASQNGEDGIQTGDSCLLSGNTTINNGRYGIVAGSNSTLLQSTITDNGNFGLLLGSHSGYAQNVIADNGTISGPQVSGGLQIGTNVCGSDTVCP